MKIPDGLLDPSRCLGTVRPTVSLPPLDADAICAALRDPIWPDGAGPSVFDLVGPGETVCFVVPDQTRRAAVAEVLRPILEGLDERGCDENDYMFLVASGIHRHPTAEELGGILGSQVATRFAEQVFLHDPDDPNELVSVGVTRRGHEIRVNRRLLEADRIVVLGTASYHYHAGFGGGRKCIVPGLASRDTIAHNHSLSLDPVEDRIAPGVEPGRLDGNPVAEAMFEAACFCRPDIIINTVLSPDGTLVGVFSGDIDLAHRAACRRVEQVCGVRLDRPADLVLASAGDAMNWIQAHKALFSAHRAMRPGGCVVLDARCPEGLGDERFRQWLRIRDMAELYRKLRETPEVNGQTALSTRTRGRDAILVTDLMPQDVKDLAIEVAPDLASGIRQALARLNAAGIHDPTWCMIPEARHLLPFVRSV